MKKKILIVCGAGGAVQLEAAAGALKALDESGVLNDAEISYMSCSGGAPVAALHASGVTGDEICSIIKNNPMDSLIKRPLFSRYMDGSGVYNLLEKYINDRALTNCRVAMTKMNKGEHAVPVMADATAKTVLASMSIQGVFMPVKIGDDLYGDGGTHNLIPTPAIGDIQNYDHIYFLIAPVDPTPPDVLPFFDYEFKALFSIWDRELIQFRESKWDNISNVTVFEPIVPEVARERGVMAELLDWSPNYVMLDEAYNNAKEKLNA